jgi:hypothetical protein
MNQTTQMHQISEHLPEYEHSFSPYYCDGPTEILRRLGLVEFTIAGNKLAGRCRGYLQNHDLPIDYQGKDGLYLFLPKNIRDNRIVLVQEGITDPESGVFHLVKHLRFLPLWLAGTSTSGLSDAYRVFASRAKDIATFSSEKVCAPRRSS